ncbi:MAG: HIT family protein [Candidatus Paceibacterota bacterium]|jgi:histidine triad (HIT) family protein
MECIFCKIINNEISCAKVWENEKFLVFLDIMPINPGHVLLIPKNHNEDIFKLEDDLYNEIFKTARKLSEPLKKVTDAKRVGMIIEGFGVDHSHIHLVPLYKGHELNPEKAQKASEDELKQMQLKLVGVFKSI